MLLVAGIGVATFTIDGGAPIVAPAVRADVPGAPPILPFLFITIACGAISGVRCLVSSGTSSKQIACETDAQFVGYGSMLTEGFLAILVILACCAGLGIGGTEYSVNAFSRSSLQMNDSYEETEIRNLGEFELADGGRGTLSKTITTWGDGTIQTQLELRDDSRVLQSVNKGESVIVAGGSILNVEGSGVVLYGRPGWTRRYDSWTAAGGLARTISAFVDGSGNFITALGIPKPVAVALMAVLVASFAATTLDTATRLQRYVIQELAQTFHIRPLMGAQGATIFAVLTAAAVAAIPPPGQTWATGMGRGGLTLWPVFGAVNQLLAGLSFMVVAFYLARRKMPTWFIAGAAVVMLVLPAGAMLYQLLNTTDGFWPKGQYHLVAAGIIILLLEFWMVAEALKLWPKVQGVLEAELPPLRRGFPVILESGGTEA